MYSVKAKSGAAFELVCLVVVVAANFFTCEADYSLKTKAVQHTTRISTILSPAFVRMQGSGRENYDFVGFIPELLKALKDRRGLGDYVIVRATDDVIGEKRSNGNWTGLMFDVITGNRKVIGAGPILNNKTYERHVKFSNSWATVHLTVVVKRISNVTTLREALDRQMTIMAVKDSQELIEVQTKGSRDSSINLSNLLDRLRDDNNNGIVDTVEEGLRHVENEERHGLLMNSEEARYYVTHEFCSLAAVENFHELGEYVFVLEPDDMALNKLNDGLNGMKADASLDRLRERELGIPGTCSEGPGLIRSNQLVTLLVVAAVNVVSARILS